MKRQHEGEVEARFIARVARACFGGGGGKGGGMAMDTALAQILKTSQAAPEHALRPNEPGVSINPPPGAAGASVATPDAATSATGAAGARQSLGAGGDAASQGGVIAPTLSGVVPRPSSGLASNGGAATKTLLG
ncbi:MAG: hypothetical protein JWN73_4873 [Betaproteobacteria bacterium]|nr:hypothetical protein [Betaproteobacteria bacterium]